MVAHSRLLIPTATVQLGAYLAPKHQAETPTPAAGQGHLVAAVVVAVAAVALQDLSAEDKQYKNMGILF
jgi:hypothetical protein